MSMIIENLNKGFEEKYGLKETHSKSTSKSTLLEKTTPEDRENSEKVKTIADKVWHDKPISDEDKKFLDTLSLELRDNRYIVPKSTPKGKENDYDLAWDSVYRKYRADDKKDYSQSSQKRLSRDQAGTSNKYHGNFRHSDEERKLKNNLDIAKDYGSDRQVKNLSTRLKKEEDRLKELRRKNSSQSQEREKDKEKISQPVRDFKSSKYYLSHRYPERKAYQDERAQRARSRYENELAEIEKDTQEVEQERKFHQDRVDTLLKRKKEESLIRRRPRRK